MRLFFRVPVYTRAEVEVERRLGALKNWIETEGRERLHERYGFSSIHYRGLAPNQSFTVMSEADDPIWIVYPSRPGALVHKGLLVRLELMGALDLVDRQDATQRDDSLFVMIDGSGAFAYENIFSVIDRLVAPPRCDLVLGKRPQDNTGMASWRRLLELFEEALLIYKLGSQFSILCLSDSDLPDSQAGCWGLRLSALKSLPLTARGYEIELDLLASALANNVRFSFVGPLKMASRGASGFGDLDKEGLENSIRKLLFITHRLSMTIEDVCEFLDVYDQQICDVDRKLPESYVAAIKSLLPKHYDRGAAL